MSSSDPKSLLSLISDGQSPLGRLALEAREKLGLSDHIRAGLAPELAAEMVSCDLDPQGILVLRASSPEWAARFRFESAQILDLCRKKRPETQSVKIRVAHPDP